MSKDKISDYSSTANSNTDIASINIDEGCAPSGINNAIRTLMAQLKNWQSGAQDVYITPAGSASAPAVTTNGDTNTGVFFPAADTVAIATGGTERARVDSSGNLGLGVTPSAWSLIKAFQLPSGVHLGSYTGSATPNLYLGANNYFNGTNFIYSGSYAATKYEQTQGTHTWYNAAGGTAGNAISFTQAMTLDASGNLSVGGTSVYNSAANRGNITIEGVSSSILNLGIGGTLGGYVFHNGTDIDFRNAKNGAIQFATNGSERARIDSSGNLLVGAGTAATRISAGSGQFSTSSGMYIFSGSVSDNSFLSRSSSGSGTATWYIGNQAITTSSDIRLKENVKPTERNAIELLNQWEIIDHTWNDPSDQCENNRNSRGVWTGISAQQVQQVTPWLVNKPAEDTNEDGSINPWTMDFGYAVPLLVKAIQEQQAIITSLTARITALEAA